MVGFGAPRRTGRLPPFVLIALLVVIALLVFNYWSVSSRQAALLGDLEALQEQVQRTEVARSRLEKRHSDLMVQAESGRRQLEERLSEYKDVEERLQARDTEAQRCEADREKLLVNVSQQTAEISHLKEQLNELRQEFLRQEDQLHEYKNNYTLLQKALKEESQQCTKQLADQKREYEESIKKLQLASKDKDELKDQSKNQPAGGEDGSEKKVNPADTDNKDIHAEDPSNRVRYDKEASKVGGGGDGGGGDAWMPEIEDSEPAKPNLVTTAMEKVDIAAVQHETGESEKQPSLRPDSITNSQVKYLAPGAVKDQDSPVEENALPLGQLPGKQVPKEMKSMIFPNLKQNDENDGQGDAAEYRKDHFGETL